MLANPAMPAAGRSQVLGLLALVSLLGSALLTAAYPSAAGWLPDHAHVTLGGVVLEHPHPYDHEHDDDAAAGGAAQGDVGFAPSGALSVAASVLLPPAGWLPPLALLDVPVPAEAPDRAPLPAQPPEAPPPR